MKSLTEYIKESQQIDEATIHQKNRNTKNVITAIRDKESSVIKTIGIITSDYPNADEINYIEMPAKQRRQINKKPKKELRAYLKEAKYVFKDVKGKYQLPEDTVMIFNIGLDVMRVLAKKYNQSSFIYIKINKDGTGDYEYYEKDNEYKIPTRIEHNIEMAKDGDDMFTRISKTFKFNIPFKFDECLDMMSNVINESFADRHGYDIDQSIRLSMNAAPMTRWYKRAQLYGPWLRQQK